MVCYPLAGIVNACPDDGIDNIHITCHLMQEWKVGDCIIPDRETSMQRSSYQQLWMDSTTLRLRVS